MKKHNYLFFLEIALFLDYKQKIDTTIEDKKHRQILAFHNFLLKCIDCSLMFINQFPNSANVRTI